MVKKHIARDWTGNRKDTIRPDEYIMFECFSYDHYYTKAVLCDDVTTSNAFRTSLRSYTVLRSDDRVNDFHIRFDYVVPSRASYRVDLLYEQSNIMYREDNPLGVTEDLVGSYHVTSDDNYSKDDDILFDGEIHYLKRITLFFDLDPSTYHFDFSIPPNCFFIGAIVRKVIRYWGDNVDSAGTNLQFTKADFSLSDMCKSSELTVTIGYDDALEYPTSPSGFYIDYMDECNLYVKDVEENLVQPFGGYVSSIQEDDDRTKLTIHCADRLQCGENTYILIQIVLNGGTTSLASNEYIDSMERSFDSYAQVLDYLCSCYEVTLASNIDENYLVGGEKFHEGFIIDFGTRNDKNKVTATNGSVTYSKNFVTLRNNAAADKVQTFSVFDYKNTSNEPIIINAKGNDINNNHGWMHITYGMGESVTETEKTEKNKVATKGYTTTVYDKGHDLLEGFDVDELAKALVISYGKCGVDKSLGTSVMAIGWISHGHSYPQKTYYKSLFENYCPLCKRSGTLIWNWRGKCWGKKNVPEGEINCDPRKGGCGADYDIPTGADKSSPSRAKLNKLAKTVKSNKKELNKLLEGKMEENVTQNPKVDEDDVFKNIAKICNKYKYDAKSGSTAAYLKAHHRGDSFAFSDLIFQLMTKWGIQCKVVQDAKGKKSSVLYKNKKNEWVNFPYRKYNFNSKLSAVSNSKTATVIKRNNVGGNISQIKELSNKTKVETTKVTHTYGYDADKPFKAYLRVGLSTSPDDNAMVYYVYPSFTLDANESAAITGLDTFWINNATRESTIQLNIVEFVKNTFNEIGDNNIYLRTVDFITPTSKENWYTSDGSVVDHSSCKLNLYQIVFNNYKGVSPSDLNCCGKNINEVFTDIVADADYVVFMDYAQHRCDDKINFNVVDQSATKFTAEEGDNNNILKWGNINYTPVSKLHNRSVVVYKSTDGMYYYVDTTNTNSILNYGEQVSLQSENEVIGAKQAYYVARNNNDFNPNQSYTYSVTVPGYPNIHLKDLVEVVSDKRKLNAVEVLEAISISYDISQIPRVQTELSLGELPDDIMVSNSLKQLRELNKRNTIFGTTASANNNKNVYTWDK